MTSRLPPQCLACAHWRSPLDRGDPADQPLQTCAAFPGGIPDGIWWNRADHRKPYSGDRGIRWQSLNGAKFPQWAMAKGAG